MMRSSFSQMPMQVCTSVTGSMHLYSLSLDQSDPSYLVPLAFELNSITYAYTDVQEYCNRKGILYI